MGYSNSDNIGQLQRASDAALAECEGKIIGLTAAVSVLFGMLNEDPTTKVTALRMLRARQDAIKDGYSQIESEEYGQAVRDTATSTVERFIEMLDGSAMPS